MAMTYFLSLVSMATGYGRQGRAGIGTNTQKCAETSGRNDRQEYPLRSPTRRFPAQRSGSVLRLLGFDLAVLPEPDPDWFIDCERSGTDDGNTRLRGVDDDGYLLVAPEDCDFDVLIRWLLN